MFNALKTSDSLSRILYAGNITFKKGKIMEFPYKQKFRNFISRPYVVKFQRIFLRCKESDPNGKSEIQERINSKEMSTFLSKPEF